MRYVATFTGALLVCFAQAGAQTDSRPNLGGIWSTTTTAITNPGWTMEELFSGNLTPDSYEYIRELLKPEHDDMSAGEIRRAVIDHNMAAIKSHMTEYGREYAETFDLANDPAIQCEYFGAVRTVLHNDPILIEQTDDRIVIKGEDMASDRVIYMDGRGHPNDGEPTTLGHSTGRYEGRALVVETVNIRANIAEDNLEIHNADNARMLERYELSEDGKRLHIQYTVIDPVMFREPLVLESVRLYTPEVQLEDAPCESISGQR